MFVWKNRVELEEFEIGKRVETLQITALLKSAINTNKNPGDLILFTQPLRSGRIWHVVNF